MRVLGTRTHDFRVSPPAGAQYSSYINAKGPSNNMVLALRLLPTSKTKIDLGG